jgi:copper chaperone NosL
MMRTWVRASLVGLLLAALLAGCNDPAAKPPPPLEPTAEAVSHFCGMLLSEHAGPKGQIFLAGRSAPVWFSSVSETVAFTMLPDEPAGVVAMYVNDMAKARNWDRLEPGAWVEARRAWYVLGSDKRGPAGMGDIRREPIPFSEEAAARRFQAAHGGRILRFSDIPKDDILGSGADADGSADRRSDRDAGSRTQ